MAKNPKTGNSILERLCDIIELYIPALCMMLLFAAFLIGIISRYVLKDPQSWTYELSTVCFLNMVIASWPYVQRNHGHIAFDMVYERQGEKTKCAMRILGNGMIVFSAAALLPAVFHYLYDMKDLTTQVIHMPRWLVFSCLFVSILLSGLRAIIDIKTDLMRLLAETGGKKS